MQLNDYLDTINAELDLRRYSNQNGRWMAQFDRCDIKDGVFLIGAYGSGTTPEAAINDYLKEIRGKVIVFHAMDKERRREFTVPHNLTYGDRPQASPGGVEVA